MPTQFIKASRAYAGAHVTANLTLWIGIFAALLAVTGFFTWQVGGTSRWGDALAVVGMVLGILVIMKSHEGYVEPLVVAEGGEV